MAAVAAHLAAAIRSPRQFVAIMGRALVEDKVLLLGLFASFLSLFVVQVTWSSNRWHFYAAATDLCRSRSATLVVLSNFALSALYACRALKDFVFGPLRTVEADHLYERSWVMVTETLIATTIFRDAMSVNFAICFAVLLSLKAFHWIAADRVDYMEHLPNISLRENMKLNLLMLGLFVADICLFSITAENIRVAGRGVAILFAFEFTLMTAFIATAATKFFLNYVNSRRGHTWENKSLYVFYLDLLHDLFKLLCFMMLSGVIIVYYGFPLYIIRDFYVTFRSFVIRVRDLVRYRRATANMETRYPAATAEELSRLSDRTCIICREDMYAVGEDRPNDEGEAEGGPAEGFSARSQIPMRLPCNHVFHFACLRSWLERQQTCPTCRRSVLSNEQPVQAAARAQAQQQQQAQQQPQQQQQSRQQQSPQQQGQQQQQQQHRPQQLIGNQTGHSMQHYQRRVEQDLQRGLRLQLLRVQEMQRHIRREGETQQQMQLLVRLQEQEQELLQQIETLQSPDQAVPQSSNQQQQQRPVVNNENTDRPSRPSTRAANDSSRGSSFLSSEMREFLDSSVRAAIARSTPPPPPPPPLPPAGLRRLPRNRESELRRHPPEIIAFARRSLEEAISALDQLEQSDQQQISEFNEQPQEQA